ncbi:hypothetical protein B0G76_7842 [Paraburkholderia sp. BL23I1N1]|uniref:hypothetical protein n=1 Tax=Paraburkholderia sp. BL23I1N1 TaxID=1938802 RepID=UPI000E75F9E0|nr:hypothetical protein [Paraburkholderia sp. BL23I1N1]RKE26230.1 hypothetical protein B0G76_7842 [Paraburkholderia sp. BL23I1N1]
MASPSQRSAARAWIGLALLVAMHLAHAAEPCDPADLGCSIFNGQQAIPAHLRDDDRPLPAWTTRCVNCHTQTDPSAAFAPPLTSATLLDAINRRGGPPSRYDPTSFCRVLKDGVDPAGVVLRKSMPHYQITGAECAALWRFVTNH